MRQFTIAAATVAIAALISAAPALADHNGGGPIKQNGQCWKASRGSDQMFGHWRACGEKAGLRGGQAQGQPRGQAPRQTTGGATGGARAGGGGMY
jgi:hypothetical protein